MKLQLQDTDGNVLEEKELVLSDGDTLVMKFDMEKLDLETANQIFEILNNGLNDNSSLVGIPSSIELQVIKKDEINY